jgi:hypothetical protein
VAAAVVIGALAVVYMTGLVIVGDPFSGLWNTTGQPVGAQGGSGYLIKQTDDGYAVTALAGTHVQGWRPLQRDGRTLHGKWYGEEMTFAYQPWSSHVAFTFRDHGKILARMTFKKATDSTVVPAEVN